MNIAKGYFENRFSPLMCTTVKRVSGKLYGPPTFLCVLIAPIKRIWGRSFLS